MVNAELFRKVAARVRSEDGEHYNQDSWGDTLDTIPDLKPHHVIEVPLCRTVACIAGNAAIESGYRLIVKQESDSFLPTLMFRKDTKYVLLGNIHDVARELLGINDEEAEYLFSYGWAPNAYYGDDVEFGSYEEVARALEAIADGVDVFEA